MTLTHFKTCDWLQTETVCYQYQMSKSHWCQIKKLFFELWSIYCDKIRMPIILHCQFILFWKLKLENRTLFLHRPNFDNLLECDKIRITFRIFWLFQSQTSQMHTKFSHLDDNSLQVMTRHILAFFDSKLTSMEIEILDCLVYWASFLSL